MKSKMKQMKTRGERKGGGDYETIINIWDLLKYSAPQWPRAINPYQ